MFFATVGALARLALSVAVATPWLRLRPPVLALPRLPPVGAGPDARLVHHGEELLQGADGILFLALVFSLVLRGARTKRRRTLLAGEVHSTSASAWKTFVEVDDLRGLREDLVAELLVSELSVRRMPQEIVLQPAGEDSQQI